MKSTDSLYLAVVQVITTEAINCNSGERDVKVHITSVAL